MSQLAPNLNPTPTPTTTPTPRRRRNRSSTVALSVCGIGVAVVLLVLWQATHAKATGISATGQATICPTSYLNPLTPSPTPLPGPAMVTYRQLLSGLAVCDRAAVLATGPATPVPWTGLAAALATPATEAGGAWFFRDPATGASVTVDASGGYTVDMTP